MELRIQKEDDTGLLVKLEGEINIYNSVSFKEKFVELLKEEKH